MQYVASGIDGSVALSLIPLVQKGFKREEASVGELRTIKTGAVGAQARILFIGGSTRVYRWPVGMHRCTSIAIE
jgi:hypothetical protein